MTLPLRSNTLDAMPAEVAGCLLVANVSGGKDSTALMLALREADLPFRAVFADTGWEAPETYRYLDTLRSKIGPIDVVGVEGGMVARAVNRAGFPGRMQRWCTRELKIEPLRAYHDRVEQETGVETVSVLGIRAEESTKRALMKPLEDEPPGPRQWGGWIWRPLLGWSVQDVIEIHRRHGVPMNPLYHRGHDRVGCYPCIFARKEEIRLLPPERVDEIERLEQQITDLRAQRNAEHEVARPTIERTLVWQAINGGPPKPRYTHERASFFQTQRQGFEGIRAVVEWSRTERGGKQFSILQPVPTGGCMRWGTCEALPSDGNEP